MKSESFYNKQNTILNERFIKQLAIVALFFVVAVFFAFMPKLPSFLKSDIVAEAAGEGGLGRNSITHYTFTTNDLEQVREFYSTQALANDPSIVDDVGYLVDEGNVTEALKFKPFVDPNNVGYKVDASGSRFYSWLKFRLSPELIALRKMGSLTISVSSTYWTGFRTDWVRLALGKAGLTQETDLNYTDFIQNGNPSNFFQVEGEEKDSSGVNSLSLSSSPVTFNSAGYQSASDEYFYLFANIRPAGNVCATHGQFRITLGYAQGDSYKLANTAINVAGQDALELQNINGQVQYNWTNNPSGSAGTLNGNAETVVSWPNLNSLLNLNATNNISGYMFLGWAIFNSQIAKKPIIDISGVHENLTRDEVKTLTQNQLAGRAQWISGNTITLSRKAGTGWSVPLQGTYILAVYTPVFFEIEYQAGEAGSYASVSRYAPSFTKYKMEANLWAQASEALVSWEDQLTPISSYTPNVYYFLPIVPQPTDFDSTRIKATTKYILIAKWALVSGGTGPGITATLYKRIFHERYVDMYYDIEFQNPSGSQGSSGNYFAKFSTGDNEGEMVKMDKDADPNHPKGYIVPYAAGNFEIFASISKTMYSITYQAPGWTLDVLESQSRYIPGIGLSSADLPVPTRAGYKFIGWKHNSNLIKTNDQLKNLDGNITLTVESYSNAPTTPALTISDVSKFNQTIEYEIPTSSASNASTYRMLNVNKSGDISAHNYQTANKGGVPNADANEDGDAVGFGWKSKKMGGVTSLRADYFISFSGTALQYIKMGAKVEVYVSATLHAGAGRNGHATSGGQGSTAMRLGLIKGIPSPSSTAGMYNTNKTKEDYSSNSAPGYSFTDQAQTLSAGWHWNSNHWRYDKKDNQTIPRDYSATTPGIQIDDSCAGVTLSMFARLYDEHSSLAYGNFARVTNLKIFVKFSEGLVETNTVTYNGNGGTIPNTDNVASYSQTFGTTIDSPDYYYSSQAIRQKIVDIREAVQIPVAPNIFQRSGFEFIGWSINSSSQNPDSGYGVGTFLNTQSNQSTFNTSTGNITRSATPITLYAVWKQVGYLVASYDIFQGNLENDGGTYFRTRKTKVRNLSHTAPTDPQAEEGDNYTGFIRNPGKSGVYKIEHGVETLVPGTNSDYTVSYDYNLGTNGALIPFSQIPSDNTLPTSSNLYCYFWELDAPNVGATNVEVVYGASIDLKQTLNFSSLTLAPNTQIKVANGINAADGTGWKRGNNPISNWLDSTNPGIIFEHIESTAYLGDNFQATIFYQVNKGDNIVLTSKIDNAILTNGVAGLKAFIYPIVLDVAVDSTTTRVYDGTAQLPYFTTSVSAGNQIVSGFPNINAVFTQESMSTTNTFGYEGKGIKLLTNYLYKNLLATEASAPAQDNIREFKNAGVYSLNSLRPIYNDGTTQELRNYNYVFKIKSPNQSSNENYAPKTETFAKDLKDVTQRTLNSKNMDVMLFFAKKAYGSTNFNSAKQIISNLTDLHDLSSETTNWIMFLDGIVQVDLSNDRILELLGSLLVRQGFDASSNQTSWSSAPADDTDPVKDSNGNKLHYEIALRTDNLLKSNYTNDPSNSYNLEFRILANNYNFVPGLLNYNEYYQGMSSSDNAIREASEEIINLLNEFNIFANQETEQKTIYYLSTISTETAFVGKYTTNNTLEGSYKGVWLDISQVEIDIAWTTEDFIYNGNLQGKAGTVTGILSNQTITFYVENLLGNDFALSPISGSGTTTISDVASIDAGTYSARLLIKNHNYVLRTGSEIEWTINKAQIRYTETSGYMQNETFNQKDFDTQNLYEYGKNYGFRWNITGILFGDDIYFGTTYYNNIGHNYEDNSAYPSAGNTNIKLMTNYIKGQNCDGVNYTVLTGINSSDPLTNYFLAHNVGNYYFKISQSKSNLKNNTNCRFTSSTIVGTNYYIGQYQSDYAQNRFSIVKRTISLTWETISEKTYNGSFQEMLAFSVGGLQQGDQVKFRFRLPAGIKIEAGSPLLSVLDVSPTAGVDVEYVTNRNISLSDRFSISAKNAKTYSIVVLSLEGLHKDNYEFATVTQSARILQKILSFTWTDVFNSVDSYVYSKEYIGPKLEVSGIQSQDGILDGIKLSFRLPVGVKFQHNNSGALVDIVTPSPTNALKDYESTANIQNSSQNNFYRFLARDANASGENYKATINLISGTENENYTLSGASTLEKTFIIMPKKITLEIKTLDGVPLEISAAKEYTYNGQNQGVSVNPHPPPPPLD